MKIDRYRKIFVVMFIIGALIGGIVGFILGAEIAMRECARIASQFIEVDKQKIYELILKYGSRF